MGRTHHGEPGETLVFTGRLSELPLWTPAVVESVDGPFELRRRLLEMGFCNQTAVTAIRRAPLGDPVAFRLRGYYVSLRKEEAECVLVSAQPVAAFFDNSAPDLPLEGPTTQE